MTKRGFTKISKDEKAKLISLVKNNDKFIYEPNISEKKNKPVIKITTENKNVFIISYNRYHKIYHVMTITKHSEITSLDEFNSLIGK